MRRRVDARAAMPQVHQRRRHRQIGERQPVADQKARRRDRAFQLGEQLRQFLALGLRRTREIALAPPNIGGRPEESGVGKALVSTCSSGWTQTNSNKNQNESSNTAVTTN